jgi:Fe-S-cluster containining protein
MTASPCAACSVCCTAYRVIFSPEETDAYPSGTVPVELTEQLSPYHVVMKGTNQVSGRCIALKGELCKDAYCSIHPIKPKPCRSYEVGGKRCNEVRKKFGLPPVEPS